MSIKARKLSSTNFPILILMIDTADHITGLAGATVAVTLSKSGAVPTPAAGAVTEVGSGWYALAGNATDRNTLGELAVHATAAGADPTDEKYVIVQYDPFLIFNSSNQAAPIPGDVRNAIGMATDDLDIQLDTILAASGSGVTFPAGANEVTFTVRNSVTLLPIDGATVWISTDLAGINVVWSGNTDAFGVARNVLGEKPSLNTGTYYGWVQDSGYTDANPTTLAVSP